MCQIDQIKTTIGTPTYCISSIFTIFRLHLNCCVFFGCRQESDPSYRGDDPQVIIMVHNTRFQNIRLEHSAGSPSRINPTPAAPLPAKVADRMTWLQEVAPGLHNAQCRACCWSPTRTRRSRSRPDWRRATRPRTSPTTSRPDQKRATRPQASPTVAPPYRAAPTAADGRTLWEGRRL